MDIAPGGSLRIRDFSTGYRGREVISGLSVPEMPPGEVVSLVGPNAAGKSTLMRALAGLLPARGVLTLGALDLISMPLADRAAHVGFMPQALPQNVSLSVLEAAIASLRSSPVDGTGISDMLAARRAVEVLSRIGIASLAMEPLDRLSGGQRQLASLAQALVRQPRVLLLDEPTSALDLRYQLQVMKLVRELAHEKQLIVVMVLHDLAMAARWSDRVLVLSHGRVAAAGAPSEAITEAVLADVYEVRARVTTNADGTLHISVDDVLPPNAG